AVSKVLLSDMEISVKERGGKGGCPPNHLGVLNLCRDLDRVTSQEVDNREGCAQIHVTGGGSIEKTCFVDGAGASCRNGLNYLIGVVRDSGRYASAVVGANTRFHWGGECSVSGRCRAGRGCRTSANAKELWFR